MVEDPKQIGRDQAYEIIYNMIMSGELPSGTVTSVAELIARLNIGRSPIRDAILRLNDDGMVQVIPRKGIFVTGIYAKDIKEMFQLRLAIEYFALENLTAIANRKILEDLFAIVDRQDLAVSSGNEDCFLSLDEDFHFFIINLLNNKRILSILDESRRQMSLYGFKGITVHENAMESALEHRRIIDAIEAKDIIKAKDELFQHLMKAQNCILLG